MRKSTKCPWCGNQMEECYLDSLDRINKVQYPNFCWSCNVCEATGPIYFKIEGKIVYKPSKNGLPK